MMNKIWETEETPVSWNVSDIKMIYKGKEKKSECENCKGIFLSSTIFKVYEKITYQKLEPIIEEIKKQEEYAIIIYGR